MRTQQQAGGHAPAGAGGNVVERHFNLAKQWRGLATRYNKLAITYRAAYILCACIAWTRASEPRLCVSPG